MFYLICFGILCALAVLNVQMHDKLGSQILSGLSALMLIGIAGLRYETGGDWDSYTEFWNNKRRRVLPCFAPWLSLWVEQFNICSLS